jgi:hypothetical protein
MLALGLPAATLDLRYKLVWNDEALFSSLILSRSSHRNRENSSSGLLRENPKSPSRSRAPIFTRSPTKRDRPTTFHRAAVARRVERLVC